MTQNIWLIRHGESAANAGSTVVYTNDTPLTEKGEQQSVCVSQAFEQAPDLIVTSPFLRAQQTAQATQQRFPDVPVEEWPIQEFTYIAPERCLGLSQDERRAITREFWLRSDPAHQDPSEHEIESFSHFIGRIDKMLEQMRALSTDFTAIFCHGHVIRAVLWQLMRGALPVDEEYMRRFYLWTQALHVPNGSILPVQLAPSGVLSVQAFAVSHLTSALRPDWNGYL